MQTAKICLVCFWKPQKQFDYVKGVKATEVGYIAGNKPNLTYEEVCSGKTGACECLKVDFDENIISYEEIIKLFFEFHDPTQLNGQGPNIGENYRSEIFYMSENQKKTAKKVLNKVNKKLNGKVVTKISDGKCAYSKAEEYHQKYYLKKVR